MDKNVFEKIWFSHTMEFEKLIFVQILKKIIFVQKILKYTIVFYFLCTFLTFKFTVTTGWRKNNLFV